MNSSSTLRFCFSNRGVMKAFFTVSGTSDEAMNLLNSVVKKGVRSVQQSFTRHGGIGPREQCLLVAMIFKRTTSSTVVNVKPLVQLKMFEV